MAKDDTDSLKRFIERALESGIEDIDSLLECIPDEALRRRLKEASETNPTKGRAASIEDLMKEILLL